MHNSMFSSFPDARHLLAGRQGLGGQLPKAEQLQVNDQVEQAVGS